MSAFDITAAVIPGGLGISAYSLLQLEVPTTQTKNIE